MNVPWSLVAILVAASATGAVVILKGDSPGVQAVLFDPTADTLCVELDGQASITGTLDATMLPGESAVGEILISHCDPMPGALLDLDFDFRLQLRDVAPTATPALTKLLIVDALSYGADDLLADNVGLARDRNLLREIDAHPMYGDNNGLLSLHELQAGVNDLPPPGPEGSETIYIVSVHLLADANNTLMGDSVTVTLIFHLSDTTHGDLN